MKGAVIDYGSGSLAPASRALMLAAGRLDLRCDVSVTADADEVARADRLVLPGQGAFADCAHGLAAVPGLQQALFEGVDSGKPFLGICVGMQLMAARGLEHEVTPGFGWIAGEIAELTLPPTLRLPQMGWNELTFTPGSHPLLDGIGAGEHAYFVHSYALQNGRADECIAHTDYGGPVAAMVARGNVAGTQFHVEKSQETGLRILANFLQWSP